MKKKILVISICMLLIAGTVISVSGEIDINKNHQNINNEINKDNNLEYPQDFEIYATAGSYVPWADIYRLEINTNGEATYSIVYAEDKHEGNGEWTTISQFELTENEMDQIWDAVEANDFFSLDSYYTGSAADGTFAYVMITAEGETNTVKTENIPVPQLDNIVNTINSFTPGEYDLFYNDILFNTKPDKPSTPSGSSSGKPKIEYTYTTTTTDANGHDIYYLFDWGDGTNSGWVGPYDSGDIGTAKHTWSSKGDYEIKVKAKDDPDGDGDLSDGDESIWSETLPISLPKNKQTINLLLTPLFQKLMNRFPILKYLFYDKYLYESGISQVKFSTTKANSGTYVTIDECDITVEIRIQISGEGATDDLATEIENEIEDVWNNDWKIKCKEDCERHEPGCPVTFDANVSKLKANETADAGSHQIEVKKDPTGKGISTVNKPFPTPNGGSAGSGNWDDNEPAGTWAHEAGHLMGLGDCYRVISEDPYRTEPKPGCNGRIMGSLSGTPSQDNVSSIVAAGGIECPCKCCPAENDTTEPENKIQTPQDGGQTSNPVVVGGYADDGPTGSGIVLLDYSLEWDGGSYNGADYPIDPPMEYLTYDLGPIYLDNYIELGDWISITTYATDAAGNTGTDTVTVTWEEEEEDTTPPITEKTIGEPQWEEGYTIASFTPIWLEATDPEPGSGVNHIHYEVWQEGIQMGSEDIPGDTVEMTFGMYGVIEGIAELRWYAVDNADNVEQTHYQEHFILY